MIIAKEKTTPQNIQQAIEG